LDIPKEQINTSTRYINVPVQQLSVNGIWYFKLHDVEYTRGFLRFRRDRIFIEDDKIIYEYKCKILTEGFLCSGHPDKKPEICKSLVLETAYTNKTCAKVTKNCLFKYKSERRGNG